MLSGTLCGRRVPALSAPRKYRPQPAVQRDDDIASHIGDQFDMRLCQRAKPTVVEQDALAIRRIARPAFPDQIGPVLQLG
jgi:hypothetical protein